MIREVTAHLLSPPRGREDLGQSEEEIQPLRPEFKLGATFAKPGVSCIVQLPVASFLWGAGRW